MRLHRPEAVRLLAAGTLAMALLGFATPTLAKDKSHHHRRQHSRSSSSHDGGHDDRYCPDSHYGHRSDYRSDYRSRHARPRRHATFVVPHRIHTHREHDYDPYYWGRVYSRPHRHYHAVYSFPVYSDDDLVYVPHAYCGEGLHARGRVEVFGRRFGFYLGF